MKKLILMAGVAAILVASCQKQKKTNEPINSQTTVSASTNDLEMNIAKITDSYLSKIEHHNFAAKPPKWLEVVGADLAGALIGSAIGGSTGEFIAPGTGGLWGGLGGGVGIGALSSIIVGNQNGLPPNAGGTSLTPNTINTFDNTGLIHYDIIATVHANPASIYVNNQLDYSLYRDLAFVRMRENNLNLDAYKQHFSVSFFSTNADPLKGRSLVDFVNTSQHLSATEKNILSPYCTALASTVNTANFGPYSVQIENSIVNNASLTSQSKLKLLITMATARHGVAYWN